jgi:hypothetical protein
MRKEARKLKLKDMTDNDIMNLTINIQASITESMQRSYIIAKDIFKIQKTTLDALDKNNAKKDSINDQLVEIDTNIVVANDTVVTMKRWMCCCGHSILKRADLIHVEKNDQNQKTESNMIIHELDAFVIPSNIKTKAHEIMKLHLERQNDIIDHLDVILRIIHERAMNMRGQVITQGDKTDKLLQNAEKVTNKIQKTNKTITSLI